MSSALLIYGATGYVGEHVARRAGTLGVKAIVAGRDAAKLDRIASETGLERRAFASTIPAAIDSAPPNRVAVVLNCAGPRLSTPPSLSSKAAYAAAPIISDITGEIPVYEAIQARDGQAKAPRRHAAPGRWLRRRPDRLPRAAPETSLCRPRPS